MKKTLVAIAALAATGAFAQSSVTLYGVVDAGYTSFSAETAGKKATVSGVGYSSLDTSRWGLSSTEDMGNGIKAGFNLESGVTGTSRDNFGYNGSATSTVTGSSSATNLFSSVGTSLGAVSGGGNFSASTGGGYTPNATLLGDRKLNAFIQSGAHKVQAGFDGSTVRAVVTGFQPMDGNILGNLVANDRSLTGGSAGQGRNKSISYTYSQPAWNATAGYVLGNNVSVTGADDTKVTVGSQFGFNYAQGPLAAGVAYAEYQGHVNAVAGVTGVLGNATTAPVIGVKAADPSNIKTKQTAAGVSYDLQTAKVYGQYGKVSINDSLGAVANNDERHFYSLGLTVPVGAGNVFAQHSGGKDENHSSAYQGKVTGNSIGYRHSFSKRTTAYAAFGAVKAATSATADVKANQTSFGILHAF